MFTCKTELCKTTPDIRSALNAIIDSSDMGNVLPDHAPSVSADVPN